MKELRKRVFKLSYFFKINNIRNLIGLAVLPNLPETVISFLATSQIGAIWTCSSDFGEHAIIDRFKQIELKILIVTDYYYYNRKNRYNKSSAKNFKKISSIEKIIIIPYEKKENLDVDFKYVEWNTIQKSKNRNEVFEKFDLIILYIFYTQCTTGVPKCIVHGALDSQYKRTSITLQYKRW